MWRLSWASFSSWRAEAPTRRPVHRGRRGALPLSRRPGFSKSALRAALDEAGIEYVHLKALGSPANGRAAARAGKQAELEKIYAGQLELPEAIAQSAQMLDLAGEMPSALLCMERDPAQCHRTLLLDAVAANAEVIHLYA